MISKLLSIFRESPNSFDVQERDEKRAGIAIRGKVRRDGEFVRVREEFLARPCRERVVERGAFVEIPPDRNCCVGVTCRAARKPDFACEGAPMAR